MLLTQDKSCPPVPHSTPAFPLKARLMQGWLPLYCVARVVLSCHRAGGHPTPAPQSRAFCVIRARLRCALHLPVSSCSWPAEAAHQNPRARLICSSWEEAADEQPFSVEEGDIMEQQQKHRPASLPSKPLQPPTHQFSIMSNPMEKSKTECRGEREIILAADLKLLLPSASQYGPCPLCIPPHIRETCVLATH